MEGAGVGTGGLSVHADEKLVPGWPPTETFVLSAKYAPTKFEPHDRILDWPQLP